MIIIRQAELSDAMDIVAVIRSSLTTLCAADHEQSKDRLNRWLENKTIENVTLWMSLSSNHTFVALKGRIIVGMIMMSHAGIILLFYVLPEMVQQGVGKLLVQYITQQARQLGVHQLTLESTLTAEQFYISQGFQAIGEQIIDDGMTYIPLKLDLKNTQGCD